MSSTPCQDCVRAERKPGLSAARLVFPIVCAALVTALAGVGWLVLNGSKTAANSGTPIVCQEAIWDFGSITQERPAELSHSYRLQNVSSDTVRIAKVVPDCGCTVVENYPTELGTNAVAELNIRVNPGGRPGPFQKFVHVVLETSPASKLTLAIQGTIALTPAMYTAPEKIDFGMLDDTETRTRTVKVARYDGSAIGFLRAVPKSDALQAKEVVHGDGADSFIELTMALDGSRLRAGDFASSVVVMTGHSGYASIEVPITAKVAAQPHGLVSSVFVDRLLKGAFQDKPLFDGSQPARPVQAVHYEGEGPITVQLLPTDGRETNTKGPMVRVSRNEEPAGPKICQGELVVRLAGREKPVRVAMRIYLPE